MLVALGSDGVESWASGGLSNGALRATACQHVAVQTRYLILAALITGIVILVASAIWLTRF